MASTPIRVCHIMSADLWAGAEVQVATAASYLMGRPEVRMTAVLFNEGWLASELRRLGVEVAVVDETTHNAWRTVAFLAGFLKDHAVDVVHTHRYKDTVLGTIAAKLAGVPHVVRTVHGLPEPMHGWSRVKFQAYDALGKLALWCCADRVVAVSQRMADVLKHSGYKARAVVHIHNGIDLGAVTATRTSEDVRRALGFNPEDLIIGSAGRFSPVKGHTFLVQAATLIVRQDARARFLFVGCGPLKDELIASAKALGVDRECLFVDPHVDPRFGIYDLVAAMDIFALPSLSEGIPMALLEAMALGTPAVATAVGGVPEIITDRATGLLVEPRDARALANACLELARDREWARTLATRARHVVEAELSHRRNGEALSTMYRDVVDERAQRPRPVGAVRLFWAPVGKCLEIARRKIDHSAARRRMRRIRRDPGLLIAALRAGSRILIVCHGNIIRSAFAERVIAQATAGRAAVSIRSAGLAAVPGRPSHPTAISTAAALDVDLTSHAAAPVTSDAVENADVIFVMDVPQLAAMRARFPQAHAKTFLLSCLASGGPLEIRDPVDGDEAVFRACFDHITRATQPIIRVMCRPVTNC